jgi:hypothetical protein
VNVVTTRGLARFGTTKLFLKAGMCLMWRLGSTQHEEAVKEYNDEVIDGLKLLPISKTLIQSTSPVKTKLY